MNNIEIEHERLYPNTRVMACGHCYKTALWRIDSTTASGGLWTDYECYDHARQWWPHLFPAPSSQRRPER